MLSLCACAARFEPAVVAQRLLAAAGAFAVDEARSGRAHAVEVFARGTQSASAQALAAAARVPSRREPVQAVAHVARAGVCSGSCAPDGWARLRGVEARRRARACGGERSARSGAAVPRAVSSLPRARGARVRGACSTGRRRPRARNSASAREGSDEGRAQTGHGAAIGARCVASRKRRRGARRTFERAKARARDRGSRA